MAQLRQLRGVRYGCDLGFSRFRACRIACRIAKNFCESRFRLCLHEKFQPGSSSARVESLYDRQKRWAFTWRQLTRVKYWYAAKSPLLQSCMVTWKRSREICICSAVQTWREIRTEVRLYDFLDPGWFQPSPSGEGWNQPGAKFQPGSSAMRHVNAPFTLCTWRVEIWPGSNSTQVETPHVNTALESFAVEEIYSYVCWRNNCIHWL